MRAKEHPAPRRVQRQVGGQGPFEGIGLFVVAPLALLSGTFYVIDNLAPAFQAISRANPFFYVISGFRFGFVGQSDIGDTNQAVLASSVGLGVFNVLLALAAYLLLRSGWKLRS